MTLFQPNDSAIQKHVWGPWISNPKLWAGEGHRICSCGKIQWADHPDPHKIGRELDQITTIKLLKDIEIDRVDGRIICDQCGKEYRDHPEDPDCPWPTFVLLCDGRHGKV